MNTKHLFVVAAVLGALVANPAVAEAMGNEDVPIRISVINANDFGPGSLRDALVKAIASNVSIISVGPVGTIYPLTPLPHAMGWTYLFGNGAVIDGSKAPAGDGLVVEGAGAISDLTFNNFKGSGIAISNLFATLNLINISTGTNGANGVTVADNVRNLVMDGFDSHCNSGSGLLVGAARNIYIRGINSYGNGEDGIVLKKTIDSRLGSIACGGSLSGVNLSGLLDKIQDNGRYGLQADNCARLKISGINFGPNNRLGGAAITDSQDCRIDSSVFSGNGGSGLILLGTLNPTVTTGNRIKGCYFGVLKDGITAGPNAQDGLDVLDAADNTFGDFAEERFREFFKLPPAPLPVRRRGNIFSGNKNTGLNIQGAQASRNSVANNIFGFSADGSSILSNWNWDVYILSASSNNLYSNIMGGSLSINRGNNNSFLANKFVLGKTRFVTNYGGNNNVFGGPNLGDGNYFGPGGIYLFNYGAGTGIGNTIQGNAMWGPIGLDGGGRTQNPCGTKTGANNAQNFPVLNVAMTEHNGTLIQGTLNSTANMRYTIDLYSGPICTTPVPNGQNYLGSTTVDTGPDCNGSFQTIINNPASVPSGMWISATATDPNGNTSEFSDCLAVTGSAGATDVDITITAAADSVAPGAPVTYSLIVSNAGPDTASALLVTDDLPAEVSFVSCDATSSGICGGTGNNRTVAFSSLASGATATITLVATASATLSNGTQIVNNATVSLGTPDPIPANNTAVAVVRIRQVANLYITKFATPEPVSVGGNLTYSIVVSNAGPDSATAVSVTDQLSPFVQFVSAISSQGTCTQIANVVSCDLTNGIFSNATASVTITVTPWVTGVFTNTVRVEADEQDPNRSNNVATAISTVSVPSSSPCAITCPANITSSATTGQSGALVKFTTPAVPGNCAGATVACVPPSGSTFPIGINTVTCTLTDTSGNTSVCSFTVTVSEAPPEAHDLAVVSLKSPAKVTLSAKLPSVTSPVTVQIVNLSPHSEVIPNRAVLSNLVTLAVHSLSNACSDLVASPRMPTKFPITVLPKGKLIVLFNVTFNTACVPDPLPTSKTANHDDYQITATVHHNALSGIPDTNPANDSLNAKLRTDVIRK